MKEKIPTQLSSILSTYNLQWEEEEGTIRGGKQETKYRPIRKYLWLGFLVIIVGLAFMIAGSVFIGLGTILASAYLFRIYWKLTNRQEEANARRFEINELEL